MAYTIGSWNWIYVNIWVAIALLNNKFNDYGYKLINGSSMWAYVSHYLIIVMVEKYVVRPAGLSFIPGFFTAFSLTEVGIIASYLVLTYVFGFSSAKDKAALENPNATPNEIARANRENLLAKEKALLQ